MTQSTLRILCLFCNATQIGPPEEKLKNCCQRLRHSWTFLNHDVLTKEEKVCLRLSNVVSGLVRSGIREFLLFRISRLNYRAFNFSEHFRSLNSHPLAPPFYALNRLKISTMFSIHSNHTSPHLANVNSEESPCRHCHGVYTGVYFGHVRFRQG